tara:strand:- start:100 stop:273 length:174 start_codon:yes stop_codon:yes gene_type:complete
MRFYTIHRVQTKSHTAFFLIGRKEDPTWKEDGSFEGHIEVERSRREFLLTLTETPRE